MMVRTGLLLLLGGMGLSAAEAPLEPVTVCELLQDATAWEGKPVVLLGRFSFRSAGRYMSEEACGETVPAGAKPSPSVISLAADEKSAPKVPQILQIDAKAVQRKLEAIQRQTSLGRFRFGSSDYDRWGAVYGQLEKRAPGEPARLLIRGDGAIVFIAKE